MKRSIRLAIGLVAAATGLASCASSPPTQFYALSAVSSQSAIPRPESADSHPARLRVAAVHIPPALDRREIVRRGSGDRLQIDGEHRWGAPFDEMVQQVLTQDLVDRLPPGEVVLPSGPAPSGTESIVVDLLQFQSDAGGAVVLQGSWSLLPSGQDTPALVRDFRYEESAGAHDYGAEADAMSRLLGRLADDIAREALSPH